MFIILEGCDGVGKTTVAQQLLDELPLSVLLHHGPPQTHPLNEYELDVDWYRPGGQGCKSIISDRFHWGELIYGPLYRGGSMLDRNQLLHVELYLKARGAVVCLLRQPLEVIRQRHEERGEDFLERKHVQQVMTQYDWISQTSLLPVLTVNGDFTDDDRDELLGTAMFLETQAAPFAGFTTLIGAHSPKALLLGETRGPNARQADGRHAVAFVPFPATSGHYLMQALLHSNWLPDNVAIANALEEDVVALHRALGGPSVVTLGEEAHRACVMAGLNHARVPHPQWVRRFHHDKLSLYAQALQQAALAGHGDFRWS